MTGDAAWSSGSFFFSSRRRHTRCLSDWSSDVCSSDLEALEKPRAELSPYAPRFVTIKVRQEKIREIIGPGGKVVRGIQEATGAKIDIEDDGRVTVFSPDNASVQKAIGMIQDICREVELDRIYLGKVKKIVEFGAFVEVIPNTEGLLHISQIAESRIRSVQDVLTEGDEVLVKVIEGDR